MRYLRLPELNQPLSVLALGTATRLFTPEHYSAAAALLDAFLQAGGNCIDTAHIYNLGKSEQTLGRWLREAGRRDELVLITKGCHPIVDPNNLLGAKWEPRVTPEAIRTDLGESLERLGTDYIDVYMLHRDDERAPVGPIIQALNDEQARGRIRAFGASNWRTARVAEANAYAAAHGLNGFAFSSPQFALVHPTRMTFPGTLAASPEDVAWHTAYHFPMLAWSTLGAGYIARAARGERIVKDPIAETYSSDENFERVRRAQELGALRGATALQIALGYVLHQPFPVIAAVGPTTPAHWHELVGALDVTLDRQELANLSTGG